LKFSSIGSKKYIFQENPFEKAYKEKNPLFPPTSTIIFDSEKKLSKKAYSHDLKIS